MEQLDLLGVALGLACLAGLNLYLTVFVIGLAIRFHWIALDPAYQSLAILADPLVIWISGALYSLEFFADKIPWVDSAWDSVHTIIRPIGGALLAIRVLGHTTPAFDVAIALAAGGASLVTHSAKASTRLIANTSPEPFSNIGLSLLEDAVVVGGLALIHYNPVLALGLFVLLLSLLIYFAPKILRAVRVKLWLIWKKLNGPAEKNGGDLVPTFLPSRCASAFARENLLGETVAWAAPCIAKRVPGVTANASGFLVATNEKPSSLFFVANRAWRAKARIVDHRGGLALREPKFLSEDLVVGAEGGRASFLFERGRGEQVERIVELINAHRVVAAEPTAIGPSTLPDELELPNDPFVVADENV